MKDNEAKCLAVMADIEDKLNALPDERQEMFWELYYAELLGFQGLLFAPMLIEVFKSGGAKRVEAMIGALEELEGGK